MIEAYLHGAAIAAVKHLDKLLGWATSAFARRKLLQQEKIDNLFWDARGFPTISGRIVSSGLSGTPTVPVREYGLQSSLHGDPPRINTWVVLDIAAVADLDDALIRLFDSTSTYLEGHYGQFHTEVTVLLFKNGVLAPKQRRTLLRLLNQVMADTSPDSRVKVGVMDYVELQIAAWNSLEKLRQSRRMQKQALAPITNS